MHWFENLIIWQVWWKLFDELYTIFSSTDFKHYYFKEQILSAALSITNNIAEGYESKTIKERKQLLSYSKRSCWEVRNMIYRAKNCWMITQEQFNYFITNTKKLSIMIYKFIQQTK